MVICRPGGPEDDVAFQSVARPLLHLFRKHPERIRLDILRPPTLEQLARVLEEKRGFYHVLHFDGHGAFPEGAGGQFYAQQGEAGVLLFENEDGSPRRVTGLELGRLLVDKGVPAVLLNACQSGMTRPDAAYPSVGNQLLQAGVGGVVAMAYSVYVATAVQFMARLYEELIDGAELGRAVSVARDHLIVQAERPTGYGSVKLQDWIVPVLFESSQTILTDKPAKKLHLDPSLVASDETARAGQEVGCPHPPDFGFIGRDGVMLDLERAFQKETIVLLNGMAGVGKTEAAMGFARWRAETGALDGPIFFSSFEHRRTVADVCDQIGQKYQKAIKDEWDREWHLQDAATRRKLAVSLLRQIPCLLIWDNFEPVAGFPTGTKSEWTEAEQGELRDFLRDLSGGETKVLITSRRDEPLLEKIYRPLSLRGLWLHEAQELAVSVLERAGVNPRMIPPYNDLLKFLGGNPLAIQVILPELKTKKPDDLLQALQSGAAILPADDAALGRTRSLAASLTYRLGGMEETQRRRLGLLGMFQEFVAADTLAFMCSQDKAPELVRGLKQADWIPLLDAATEVGLLRRIGGGYYTVHPALPWFFHALRNEAFADENADWPEIAYIAAYAAYGRYLFDLLRTNPQVAMNLLRAEEANLTFALRLAETRDQWDSLGGVLHGLFQLWKMQARWIQADRVIKDLEVKVTAQDGEPIPERESIWLELLEKRTQIANFARDFVREESILRRLLEHYEGKQDEANQAAALHQLGVVAQEHRDFEAAERWYRQSLEITERIGDEHSKAQTLHQLGVVAQEHRDFEAAERWYRQSLEIKERIGDEHGKAQTLHNLGAIAQEHRDFDEAERWYRQALPVWESLNAENEQGATLHNLGVVAQERRDFDEAERWYRQSLEIKERIGNEHGKASTLHQLGIIAQERRDFDEAERWYRQSLEIKERIGDEHGKAQTLHQLGRIAEERRDFDEAERWYRQSLEIKERIGDEHGKAITLHQLGRIAEMQDKMPEATGFYEGAAAIFRRVNDDYSSAVVQRSLDRAKGVSR